ncbi:hypothetical protein EHS13_30755 [Paenibacillus psychroresistens]|uniref:Tissue inhibitor of metalloproteinase n=1 Tax=Paenibacillus psychroresistens TaxID=1778678 RepID=A0A6B8RUY9_9BACL|nr:hypothetical protein [Paenibacillus psychroresistens]QGQ98948.1 hypothetical protein EHS13_30755 [Paenibacillus psychroresistens]
MVRKYSILLQLIVLIVCSIIGMLTVPTISYACSCAETGSTQAELQKQTAVFSGKVTAVSKPFKVLNQTDEESVKVAFEVYRVWKGEIGKKVAISTGVYSASCGFTFEKNQEYLVFANGDISNLEASLCSKTQAFLTAGKDIDGLGTAILSPIDDPVKRSTMYYTFAVGSLALVILSFIVVMRRRLRS